VAVEHRVDTEAALAFRDDVDRTARQVVQLLQLGGQPVAEHRQRQVINGRAARQRPPPRVEAGVGELADRGAWQRGAKAVRRVAAGRAPAADHEHRVGGRRAGPAGAAACPGLVTRRLSCGQSPPWRPTNC